MYLAGLRFEGVDIWDYASKQHLATIKPNVGCNRCFTKVSCFSNHGRMLAIKTRDPSGVSVWDISGISPTDTSTCREVYQVMQPAGPHIDSICFTKDDEQLLVGFYGSVVMCDARSGHLLRILDGFGTNIVLLHPVGDGILTALNDGTITVWDSTFTWRRHQTKLDNIICGCVARSEDRAAFSVFGDTLHILNLATLEPMVKLNDIPTAYSLQFNAGGDRLLAEPIHGSSNAAVYNLETGKLLFRSYSVCDACFGWDFPCIYGCTGGGALGCWDAETGSALACPFSATVSKYCYVKLMVHVPAAAILM
jgi:WD40 repeat protein